LSLITVALVEGARQQLDLVAFDGVVKVDTFILDGAVVMMGRDLSLERFDLVGQCSREHDELLDTTLELGFRLIRNALRVVQNCHRTSPCEGSNVTSMSLLGTVWDEVLLRAWISC